MDFWSEFGYSRLESELIESVDEKCNDNRLDLYIDAYRAEYRWEFYHYLKETGDDSVYF